MGMGADIAKPIEAVGELYTTDKARINAETIYQGEVQKPRLAQLATNAILANSGRLFNSGWQPLIAWSCGFLILLFYAPQIVIITIVWGRECFALHQVSPFPMKADDLLNLVYLLFGFGVHSVFKK
jgi:hypothetical protein